MLLYRFTLSIFNGSSERQLLLMRINLKPVGSLDLLTSELCNFDLMCKEK